MKNQGFTLNNPILIAFCRNSSKSSCRLFVCKCLSETVRIRKYNVLFKLGGVTCTTFFFFFNYLNRVAKYPGNLAGNVQREVRVLLSNIMQLRATLSFSFTGLLSFCTAPMQIDFMYFRTRSLSLCIARHTS